MSNPTFKPSEGKREEFRKYLEKGGVMDALTKVLVNLYEEPEKPEDALEYIRDRLAMQAGIEIYSEMKTRLEEFQTRIDDLTQELESLKAAAEPPPEGEAGEALLDQMPPEGEEGVPPEGDMPRATAAQPHPSASPDAGRASASPPPEEDQQPAEPSAEDPPQ